MEEMEEIHDASLTIQLAANGHSGVATIEPQDQVPHVTAAVAEVFVGLEHVGDCTYKLSAPKERHRLGADALNSFAPVAMPTVGVQRVKHFRRSRHRVRS